MVPQPRGFFQSQDPPVHDVLRRALTREFMIKRINALRPAITRLTEELLTGLVEQPAPADLVEHFALPLPSLVICELLGVPYEDHDFFQEQSKVFVDMRSRPTQIAAAFRALNDYLTGLIREKQRRPGDDVLSRLGEQVSAGSLELGDAADMASFLLFAGHETTANMIALSTVALLEHPDRIPAVLAGPESTANAVEELLRYLTIVHHGLRRYALEDMEINGTTIRAGEGVLVSIGPANRDPEAFGDPDRLDVERAARHHVAFGYGIHQCLGQPLARAELQIALPALFERLPGLQVAVPLTEIAFKQETSVYGIQELPITW
jgi:cytochrome P450